MDDKKKLLYDAVSKDYDVGTFDDFNSKLQDPEKRKAFYNGVGKEYELGTYDEFNSKLDGELKKKDLSEPTTKPSKVGGESTQTPNSNSEAQSTSRPSNSFAEAVGIKPPEVPHEFTGTLQDKARAYQESQKTFAQETSDRLYGIDKRLLDINKQSELAQQRIKDNEQAKQHLADQYNDKTVPKTQDDLNAIADQHNKANVDNINTDLALKNMRVEQLKLQKLKTDALTIKQTADDIAYNAEGHKIESLQNFGTALYNSVPEVVSGIGDLAKSVGQLSLKANPLSELALNKIKGSLTDEINAKITDPKKKEQALAQVNDLDSKVTAVTDGIGNVLRGVGKELTIKSDDIHPEKHQLANTLGGLTGMVAQLALGTEELNLTAKGAKILTAAQFGLNAANTAYDEAESKGMDKDTKSAYVVANTLLNASLANAGLGKYIDRAFGNTLIKEIMGEVKDKVASEGLTGTGVLEATAQSLKDKAGIISKHIITNGVKNVGEGMWFGGVTKASDIALKRGVDAVTGKPYFKEDEDLGKNASDVWESAKAMGIAGGIFGLATGGTGNANGDKSFYDKVVALSKDPNAQKDFNEQLDAKLKSGQLTEQEVGSIKNNVGAVIEANSKIPSTITDGNKRIEAINLIAEKNKLQKENDNLNSEKESLDPAMNTVHDADIEKISKRIESINSDLALIAKGAERVSMNRKDLTPTENVVTFKDTMPPAEPVAETPEVVAEKPVEDLTNNDKTEVVTPEVKTEPKAEKVEQKGKAIEPHKEVSASKANTIKEIAPLHGLKEMEAGVLHGLKDLAPEEISNIIDNEKSMKGAVAKKLIEKGFIDEGDWNGNNPSITEQGKAFIDAVDNRLETRRGVKEGTDLFPEDANIPEFKAINKHIEDGTITKKQVDKIIESADPTELEKSASAAERETENIEGVTTEKLNELNNTILNGEGKETSGNADGVEPPNPSVEGKGTDGEKDKPIGMTREIMRQEDVEKGLNTNEREELFKSSKDKDEWQKVSKQIESNPNLPIERRTEVFNELLTNEHPKVSSQDILIAIHEKARLNIELDRVSDELSQARKDGDNLKIVALEIQRESIENQQEQNRLFGTLVSSESAKGLRNVGILTVEDFSYAGITHEIERLQGKELSEQQKITIRKLTDDYAELQKQMRDLQTRVKAEEEIRTRNEAELRDKQDADNLEKIKAAVKDELEKQKNYRPPLRSKQAIREDLEKSRAQFRIDIANMSSGGLQALGSFTKVVKLAVEYGIKSAEEFYKEFKDDFKGHSEQDVKNAFNEVLKKKHDTLKEITKKAVDKSGGELHEGMKGIVNKMLKEIVTENPDINHIEATDKVFESLRDAGLENLKREDVRDLISGYGKYKLLSKEAVNVSLREIRAQNRLDAALEAVKEKEQLPLRTGMERHEKSDLVREKEREVLRIIKEKGLTPELSDADIEAQYKSAEESYHKKLTNAIADIQKEIDENKLRPKSDPKKYTGERIKELQADLKRLRKEKDEKFNIKEKSKEKRTEDAIADIQKEIDLLKKGEYSGIENFNNPKVQTKEGKQVFSFGKEKNNPITSARIKELETLKKNLQSERSNFIPAELKRKAIIEKERTNRQRRLDNLEKQLADKKFAPAEKAPKVPYDEETYNLNLKIKKKENEIYAEKRKIELANRGNLEKAIEGIAHVQRFAMFLDPEGMLRLTYAALFRPLVKPLSEIAKVALSNVPVTSKVMEKSAGMYRPTIKSGAEALKNYYTTLLAKKTFQDAKSEFNKRSNYSLLNEGKGDDRYRNTFTRVTVAPEQMHGALKAFPKIAAHESTYKVALENLSTQIDPETGKLYDITHPYTMQKAFQEAMMEASADVFMSNSEVSALTNKLLSGAVSSENVAVQMIGLYGKQLQPVLKVPPNFYHEVLDQLPIVGMLDAAQVIARSGERGARSKKDGSFRGIENLTPEQAHKAARALVNQTVGLMMITTGVVLYGKELEDKMKKYGHWLHNTGFPLFMQGMAMAKDIKEGKGAIKSTTKESVGTIYNEGKKLPQVGAAENLTWTAEGIGRFVRDKETWDKASLPLKKMIVRVFTPNGLAKLADVLDKKQKRYPQTFKQLIEMRIPGLKDLVPAKKTTNHKTSYK